MRDVFSYTEPVMLPIPRLAGKTWPGRVVFYALAVAIFSLSLQSELDMEIAVSQSSHSFIAKVNKDFRQKPGGQRELASAATLVHWIPSFHPYFLRVVDKQKLPALHLLKSAIIRAPPSAFSV